MEHFNYVAIVVAAVIAHILGALWYSPVLFGKAWMDASGFSKQKIEEMKKKGMAKSYVLSFLGSLVTAFVLACIVAHSGVAAKPADGAAVGFWCWLGFVAPVVLGAVLWEGKTFSVYAIKTGYYLVALLLMGGILAGWPAKTPSENQAIAFYVPILPGKTDAWKKFAQEYSGLRQKEFAESRKRMGVVAERSYLQQTPAGDAAVIFVQGNNVRNFFHILGASQDPFDVWFREQVLAIHGTDLTKELPPTPQEFLDWHAKKQ